MVGMRVIGYHFNYLCVERFLQDYERFEMRCIVLTPNKNAINEIWINKGVIDGNKVYIFRKHINVSYRF